MTIGNRRNMPEIGRLIFAEKLLSVLDEADDHYHGGAGHAHEEHDFQDIHCEQAYLEHENDCNPDGCRFPFSNFVPIERSVPVPGWGGGKPLCQLEIDSQDRFFDQAREGRWLPGVAAALC
jgi:hypothetical protein